MVKKKALPPVAKSISEKTKKYEAYLVNVKEAGMMPYNAAMAAGYTPKESDVLSEKSLAENIFGRFEYRDLAERCGITPLKIIKYLAERAGFFDRENGAKKVVSLVPSIKRMAIAARKGAEIYRLANPDDETLPPAREAEWDWVEVPDDAIQQKYMAMLLDFLQYTGKATPGSTVPVDNGAKSFSIHFHVLPEEKEAKKIMDLALDDIGGVNGK